MKWKKAHNAGLYHGWGIGVCGDSSLTAPGWKESWVVVQLGKYRAMWTRTTRKVGDDATA